MRMKQTSANNERTETRRLPNYFECVYPEDFEDGGCGASDIDPAATTKDRDGVEGVPKKKSDVNGKTK